MANDSRVIERVVFELCDDDDDDDDDMLLFNVQLEATWRPGQLVAYRTQYHR